MDSPLTQQLRPDSFEPKIVQLYLHLFNVLPNDDSIEDPVPAEGFWREFFLLKPDKERLYDILEPFTASEILHCHVQTQGFFQRCIAEARSSQTPQNENALENLAGFLSAVFTKRYMNPSTDIIDVLGGLDSIDKLVSDLVGTLENAIRSAPNLEFRSKAVTTAMVMVAGAFQTSLVSYFTHRDIFPALMRYVYEVPDLAYQSYTLLGSLASYNKFEQQNVYQNRLEDFVDESTIRLLVESFAETCQSIRSEYTTIHDDSAPTLTLSSALSYVGLRSLSPDARKPPPPNEDEAKQLFNNLPSPLASTLLSTYTFVSANKIFASALLTTPTTHEAPLSSFLSTTSYLCHHAHRSSRGSTYATLTLLTLRLLLEDPLTARPLCHATAHALPNVRLARQRAPFLPLPTPSLSTPRPPAAIILDIATDTLSHNLRRRLDVGLYSLALSLILRVLTTLAPPHNTSSIPASSTAPIRLQYHYPHLWSTLLSLVKFTTTYATDLQLLRDAKQEMVAPLAEILAFSLTRGDVFLPGEAEFDDLFYKLVEGYELLGKFREAWAMGAGGGGKSSTTAAAEAATAKRKAKASGGGPVKGKFERATDALLAVAGHYHGLLTGGGKRRHQSAVEVKRVIKEEGYEGLDLGAAAANSAAAGAAGAGREALEDAFGHWEPWREVERKAEVKRLVRVAMDDVRVLGLR